MKHFVLLMGLIIGLSINPALASTSTGQYASKQELRAFDKLQQHIFEAERKTGTDAELLTALLSIESTMGIDTRNKHSKVRGVMQYTDRQWRYDVKRFHKQLGLSANASVNNPRAAILVTAAALADNKAYLERRTNRTITSGDLYMAHFVGLYGAEKILKGKSSASVSRYVTLHKGNGKRYHVKGKVATVAQFRAKLNNLVKDEKGKYTTALNQVRLDNVMEQLANNRYHNQVVAVNY